ncbi:MAG TPA: hypothetical protein VIF32_04330, partial [Gemmatimonadaceae bacterium]
MRFGRKAGDAVRDRLAHLVNKKEAKVIDGRDIHESMVRSALWADTALSIPELRQQGESMK